MCGIAGIAAFGDPAEANRSRLETMVDTLRHRGPDDSGLGVYGAVALGMRRLAIIDLATGKQPIQNEDGSIRVVFNGEIYNYRQLRCELRDRGHVFATNSDTEVIVHSYEEYGLDFARKLNGMFAIALHDTNRNRLVLARDPIGIKPLYYSFDSERLVWGSEIKAVLASGLVERELDPDALAEFLVWEYVPAPGTLLRSIRKLEPATLLAVDLDDPRCEPKTYWTLDRTDGPQRSESEWEEALESQLADSTRSQLVSDVSLGAFLSGGVDSSLVVWAMGEAQTFSIGFDDPSYNEMEWARKVADHLRVDHVDRVLKSDSWTLFPELMHHLDDPIADFSIFPTYLVSRLAREHVTVALSGDGGDEILGGYETYAAQNIANRYARLPRILRRGVVRPLVTRLRPTAKKKGTVNKMLRFLQGLDLPEELQHTRWRLFADEHYLSEVLTPELSSQRTRPAFEHVAKLFRESADMSPVDRMLFVDLKSYLPDNILTKVDRMSMAVSLEARVPYLDTDMVDLAFQIPDRLKVDGTRTKVLLKRIASHHVPRECVYRAKEGFSIPMKNWLKREFRPTVDEYLSDERIQEGGVFQRAAISRIRGEHDSGRANHSHLLWSLVVFQAWRERWLDS